MFRKKLTAISLTMFAIFLFYLFMLSTKDVWRSFSPATCIPYDCFCEGIREGVLLQPINTISSFAFVFTGLYILFVYPLWLLRHKRLVLIPITLILIGVGSAFYHATLTFVGQFLDVASMYLLASFMVSYALYRHEPMLFFAVFIVLNVVLDTTLVIWPQSRRFIFGFIFLCGVLLEVLFQIQRRFYREFIVGLFIFVISYIGWVLDRYRLLCFSDSWIQGHALWHIGGAVASYFLFGYYKKLARISECKREQETCDG